MWLVIKYALVLVLKAYLGGVMALMVICMGKGKIGLKKALNALSEKCVYMYLTFARHNL